MKNKQVLLAKRPRGRVEEADFRIVETETPAVQDGQLLTRVHYLSLDPYMRGRMDESKSYAPSHPLGAVMIGGTVAEVVESKNPKFKPGDFVVGMAGWQQCQVSDGAGLRKIDVSVIPPPAYLGCVGMPGVTAWYGLTQIGKPKEGETVVVSAAAGAVGSVVGQLAKIRGCRAVGVAGSEAKCELVVKELGFDACVNYRQEPLLSALQKACPKGIDVYFDNVGGDVLAAVLRLINRFARIPLCGLISQYNATELPPGPNFSPILVNRALIRGFIVSDHGDRFADFHRDCAQWLREGRIRYREDVVVGLENAPEAFIGLLRGRNVGKLVVKVGDDPTVKSC